MNYKLLLYFTLFMLPFPSLAHELKTFSTDYCTGFPEGTPGRKDLWKHCCLMHDLYFWAGGSIQDRNESDLELRSCVAATGEYTLARIIYLGVRAGSRSPYKLPGKKWGNGWSGRNQYQALSLEEYDFLYKELSSGYVDISIEIKNHLLDTLRSRME